MTDLQLKISKFSSQKLCEIIVTARYLGSLKQQAILCMQELAQRRATGEIFDYESHIETELKKLPDFKTDLKKILRINGFDLSFLKKI